MRIATARLARSCAPNGAGSGRAWRCFHKQEQWRREQAQPKRGKDHGDADMRCLVGADAKSRCIGKDKQHQHQHQRHDRPDIAEPPGQPRGAAIFPWSRHHRQHRVVEHEAQLHRQDRQRRQCQRQHGEGGVRPHQPQPGGGESTDQRGHGQITFRRAAPVGKPAKKGRCQRDQQRACRSHPGPGDGAALRHHGGGKKYREDEGGMKRRNRRACPVIERPGNQGAGQSHRYTPALGARQRIVAALRIRRFAAPPPDSQAGHAPSARSVR